MYTCTLIRLRGFVDWSGARLAPYISHRDPLMYQLSVRLVTRQCVFADWPGVTLANNSCGSNETVTSMDSIHKEVTGLTVPQVPTNCKLTTQQQPKYGVYSKTFFLCNYRHIVTMTKTVGLLYHSRLNTLSSWYRLYRWCGSLSYRQLSMDVLTLPLS